MQSEWQPINSAPLDERVLLYPQYVVAHWEFGDELWIVRHHALDDQGRLDPSFDMKAGAPPPMFFCEYADGEPTHWMPLPKPPKRKGNAE